MVGSLPGSVAWGFLLALSGTVSCIEVTSDAAVSFDFGVYFQGFWFTGRWAASLLSQSIPDEELFPVVVPFSSAGISAVGSKGEACSDINSHPSLLNLTPPSSSRVLSAAGQAPSVRVTVWNLFVCKIFGTVHSSLQHQGVFIRHSGLHVEQRFADPLKNNLHLYQGNLGGINLSQGLSSFTRSPITGSIIMVIWESLNMTCPDYCMFWTACTLGYFGFLNSAEFTMPSLASFSASLHPHPHWSGCLSSLCSSSQDGVSCALGQCPRTLVYALRWSPAASCTSHGLAVTDIVCRSHSGEFLKP